MSITENHITVNRTARYFTYGNADIANKILIVLHGYSYLAKDTLAWFAPLGSDYFIIAPEALSRFYVKGFYGNTGASWMTKEDRHNEIKDYVYYLDKLFNEIILPVSAGKKITALGFSQGTSTLSRWLSEGNSKIKKAIYWCGFPAEDINYKILSDSENHIVLAEDDFFIPHKNVAVFENKLKQNNFPYHKTFFQGGHELRMDILKKIL